MKTKSIILALLGVIFGAAGIGTVENVYADLASMVIAIPLFAEFVIINLGLKKILAQLVTWLTGVVFVFCGWLLNLGFMAVSPAGDPYLWYEVLALAAGITLIANGMWPVIIKEILRGLKLM